MTKKVRRIYKDFTPARKAQVDELRKKLDAERPEIEAMAKAALAAHRAAERIVAQLKAERERQGLSLADIKQKTGFTRESISALENSEAPNPTIKTLQRYAMALGVKLEFSLR
jgi:DNA-binding phage protein